MLIDYMYQERREEEDFLSLKTALTHQYNGLKTTHKKHEGGLITSIRNNTDNTIDNKMRITRKQKWEEKLFYERFNRLINNISHGKT